MHKVFVYGTLLSGLGNHARCIAPYLATGQATLLGEAQTRDAMTLGNVSEAFPALTDIREGPSTVKGEVYLVDDACLAELDRLEGVPSLYVRLEVPVTVDGETCDVYTYVWADTTRKLPTIPSGSWREHKRLAREGYASSLSRILSAIDGDIPSDSERDPRYETLMNMITDAAELAGDLNESSVEDTLWNLAEVLA